MIAIVQGVLLERAADHVIVDVGGLGYRVHVPLRILPRLGEPGSAVKLRTRLEVREDSWTLFGFETQAEVDMYLALTSVSGIGPKMALAVLSAHSVSEIASGILAEDAKMFTRISGIGKKTVGRLFLELRDKVGGLGALEGVLPAPSPAAATPDASPPGASGELRAALEGLGYKSTEAAAAVQHAVDALGAEAGLDDLLRSALGYFRRSH